MKAFAQNRTTIDFTAVFRSIEIVAICFDTSGGGCDARDSELTSIGLALIAQYIILGRDDECGWKTL
jgi:hypothetical protein